MPLAMMQSMSCQSKYRSESRKAIDFHAINKASQNRWELCNIILLQGLLVSLLRG